MSVEFTYIIVGGGMAAHSAARGIRDRDPDGSILIIGQEPDAPYDRPPLTKGLWDGQSVEDIDFHTAEKTGAVVWTGTKVTRICPENHTVIAQPVLLPDDSPASSDTSTSSATPTSSTASTSASSIATEEHVSYEKLLLATGGHPRTLCEPSARVIYFRTRADYVALRELAQPGMHIAVLGGGFIGIELAASLASTGAKVTLVVSSQAPGSKAYPPGIVQAISGRFAEHEVAVLTEHEVTEIEEKTGRVNVYFDAHPALHVDGVVAGFGIEPNNALALDGGLPTEAGGIVVNQFLQTSDSSVFAAGDVAYFPDPLLGRRRVEHVDQALKSGRTAGHNMVRVDELYERTPYFYSDIFDLGFEAVGRLDSRLEMYEDWAPGKAYKKGVVYYLDNGGVVGVLLWNVWDSTQLAREVIGEFGEPGSVTAPVKQLRGRIPH